MNGESVVIIGGSITGLTGALALRVRGFDVTIVERDVSPAASITPETSSGWMRKGALHALQPHVLTARLRNVLHEWYPDLVRELIAAGAWEQGFAETVHDKRKAAYRPLPEDEAITVLMTRRTTLELVMRRYVEARGIATLLAGTEVTSLVIEGEGAPLTVRGVRIKDGAGEREIQADVVIDASGRTTKFADALRQRGAVIADEHHTSNSVYYARHYRLKPGKQFPKTIGMPGAIFGDFAVAAFPGDNRTSIVTFGLFKDDPLLHGGLNKVDVFERVCRGIPNVAEWIDPQRAEPTSGVMAWASMDFLWRTTVANGTPQVLGFFFAGDSVLRSNPKYGRGCTCGTIGSRLLADTLAAERDPARRVVRYEAALRDAFRPEWDDLLAVDKMDYARFQRAAGLRPTSFAARLQERFQNHLLRRAVIVDPNIHRAIIKGFFGLARPTAWTKSLKTWLRIAAAALPIHDTSLFADRWVRPSRDEIKTLIEASSA